MAQATNIPQSAQEDLRLKEWLRPKEGQSYLGIKHDKFYSLVRQGAFRVSKPAGGKLTYVRRSELDDFLENGFPK